ncbi:gram-negative porin family protein [Paraburkholderia fungorum]|uniref:Gram-negative porin family protein n=1 Tax=Paraburkholderia fungorum TaxID=134537 RepID=A0AAU8SSS0_9BURK|nr:porin [Paraburkholderia fungorum]AJZ56941.1 gram-negative porin family protein [Paraburkholderia fungorum]
MKTLIGLGALVVAGSACAQSSVTLYGIADAGLTYSTNAKGAHQYALTSGNEGAGRWGLSGVEVLGGGLKTIFTLEAGYNIANGTIGQNGTEFGRQAFVGMSGAYGTLTLGRQYASSTNFVGPFESGNDWAASGATYGAHPADLDNLDNSNRINNAIKFQSLKYAGFSFGGLYSLGGKAGSFTENQIWSLGAGYANGPLNFGVGYLQAKSPNFSLWGNKANDSATGSNIASPVISGYATAASQQVVAAGGSYALGAVTIGGVYSNVKFKDLGSATVAGLAAAQAAYRGTATFNSGELNLKFQVTPTLLLAAAYAYTKGSGVGAQNGARYQQINVGADYFMSKRTDLYAVAVHQRASGTDSTGHQAVAAISGASPSSSSAQTLVTVGIRHKF